MPFRGHFHAASHYFRCRHTSLIFSRHYAFATPELRFHDTLHFRLRDAIMLYAEAIAISADYGWCHDATPRFSLALPLILILRMPPLLLRQRYCWLITATAFAATPATPLSLRHYFHCRHASFRFLLRRYWFSYGAFSLATLYAFIAFTAGFSPFRRRAFSLFCHFFDDTFSCRFRY